jgi:hypothetical protein
MAEPNAHLDTDECVIHDHPVPPEELHRYSVIRDPAAEKDIADYVASQARDEEVKHVERVKTEYVAGTTYEIWDVSTDKNRWWVLTNGTNLYNQKFFPSLDYTLSFHIGLMMRVMSRSGGPEDDEPSPFTEVFRRHEQASERYERAVEAEEYQAVGMQLRECLIALSRVMQRHVEFPEGFVAPKAADFKGWSTAIYDQLLPGSANQELRQYIKTQADKTWSLVSSITHDSKANDTATMIALDAVETCIDSATTLLMRDRLDKTEKCPTCSSRNVRTHYDTLLGEFGEYFESCGACDWTSHPGYDEEEEKPVSGQALGNG